MSSVSNYVDGVLKKVQQQSKGEVEYLQAVEEFMPTVKLILEKRPDLVEHNILEVLLEPERIIQFRVPWQDDKGNWCVNRGFRVQYNSAMGPYKGGLRFHPSVNLSVMKFLAFEQIFKNSLTGLPIGGGKGGSDFDPKGKSDAEVMRFCQSFMTELSRHIGPDIDVPAGDIGVGGREIGYLFGQYKRLKGYEGRVLTGKPLAYWGSLARTEATGYGLVYFVQHLLEDENDTFKGKTVAVSGSGNVAIYAIQKAQQLGAKVITCSDSNGYIIDPDGISLDILKEIKEINRARVSDYVASRPNSRYVDKESVWSADIQYDIALPCATQNEISLDLAKNIQKAGAKVVAEGANMPTSLDAMEFLLENKITYCPGKASNAGGVAVSALEMAQNSQRIMWTFEEVDNELNAIMKRIYRACRDNATVYATPDNLVAGANIAGFEKVADAMVSQGLV